ncbi:MAG: TetR/AcrR family transcriptional regulator [Alicyclobacillus macrosporangiidus]|uniref:TetR/AcrR family transcriptional regulator n=1 Tax=Alicyclobacillus macrosporangiidus TaxID=392015 RepID=UPI0026EF9664|nr:TetR/AcrR family transcriptional regulator [Alicyclobacillus macrosporangiidus]MCL6601209.1 TetR/AcrR family transcriptional regulator [Alicyclobacillus macrosporangiidus]
MHKEIESDIKNLQLLAERRAILCRAAARLFRKKGYDRTTIPEIAQEAGMSVGSIYRYVKKKEDIIYLLYRETVSQLERNVYNVCAAELPPFEKLFCFISRYYRFIDDNRDALHVGLRDMNLFEGFRETLQKQESRTLRCIESILQEGIEKGVFAPVGVPLLAYNIIMLGHMWVMRSYRLKGMTIDEYIAQQYDFMHRILTPGPMGTPQPEAEEPQG